MPRQERKHIAVKVAQTASPNHTSPEISQLPAQGFQRPARVTPSPILRYAAKGKPKAYGQEARGRVAPRETKALLGDAGEIILRYPAVTKTSKTAQPGQPRAAKESTCDTPEPEDPAPNRPTGNVRAARQTAWALNWPMAAGAPTLR